MYCTVIMISKTSLNNRQNYNNSVHRSTAVTIRTVEINSIVRSTFYKGEILTCGTSLATTVWNTCIHFPNDWAVITSIGSTYCKTIFYHKYLSTVRYLNTKEKCGIMLPWQHTTTIGSLSNNDGDGNEDGKRSNRFTCRLAKQQLCTCIMLVCTFLAQLWHEMS